MAEMKCKRMREMKEFEESMLGVKGLLDSGITTIPHIFIHPPETLFDLKPASFTNLQVPIIDLSSTQVVREIKHSLSTWGFFQVINHGIPTQVIEETIKAFKSFHEQENKSQYVWDKKVLYNSNQNILLSNAVNWKDSLRVFTSPNPPNPETIPSVCRKELMEWDECMKKLCERLMELICDSLGVDLNRFKELSCLETRKFACHYYPYCPQPDLTVGLPTHTDKSLLALVVQNEVSGLQVKYDNEWVDVEPVPGAVIVNAGDLLQIFSNDKFQSVEHRVLANTCEEPRISLAVFFSPGKTGAEDCYGPLAELLSSENPARYRKFNIPEILKLGQDGCVKAIVELFKLNG